MNKHFNKFSASQKGFTIIELIVVIAIIALLASIVLVNVVGYINKGKDAAIQGDLHTVQTGVISDNTGSTGLTFTAGDVCSTSSDSTKAWTAILASQTGSGLAKCYASTSAFCACVESIATPANFFCIDSTGAAKTTATSCLTACAVGGTFECPS